MGVGYKANEREGSYSITVFRVLGKQGVRQGRVTLGILADKSEQRIIRRQSPLIISSTHGFVAPKHSGHRTSWIPL